MRKKFIMHRQTTSRAETIHSLGAIQELSKPYKQIHEVKTTLAWLKSRLDGRLVVKRQFVDSSKVVDMNKKWQPFPSTFCLIQLGEARTYRHKKYNIS